MTSSSSETLAKPILSLSLSETRSSRTSSPLQDFDFGFEFPTNTIHNLADHVAEKKLLRKCDLHILPVLFIMYTFAFLDRINIGNAKIQGMPAELKLVGNQYNVALLIFFVPYILLEVPSNLLLRKVSPSTYLSCLIFLWGVAATCQGFVTDYHGLVVCRVVMGVFEAGVFPGSAYLISMYYKRHELQKRWSAFFCSGLVAGAFGGLLAFALVKLDGTGGYSGWRWIFIIEGLATVVFALFAKFLIPDWPEDASFLDVADKSLLIRRLANDGANGVARMDRLDRKTLYRILGDWKIWIGTLIYMGVSISGYSTAFFVPTILNEFGFTPAEAQLHTIPVYAVGVVFTLFTAYLSDRLRHRYMFTMLGIFVATIGYIILLAQSPSMLLGIRYFAIFLITTGTYITQPITIVWLSNNMGGHYKRSFGPAIQIGLGNIGGIIGSLIYVQKEMPRYRTGYSTGLGMLWLAGAGCSVLYFRMMAENRKRERGERDGRLNLPKEVVENLGDDHPEFRFSG